MGFHSIERNVKTERSFKLLLSPSGENFEFFVVDSRPWAHLQKFRLNTSKNKCHEMALGHSGCLAKLSQLICREPRTVKMMMGRKDLKGMPPPTIVTLRKSSLSTVFNFHFWIRETTIVGCSSTCNTRMALT